MCKTLIHKQAKSKHCFRSERTITIHTASKMTWSHKHKSFQNSKNTENILKKKLCTTTRNLKIPRLEIHCHYPRSRGIHWHVEWLRHPWRHLHTDLGTVADLAKGYITKMGSEEQELIVCIGFQLLRLFTVHEFPSQWQQNVSSD